ncbi:GFA family protein [soil metagenome]
MIQGSCLCGAVHWRFDGTPERATACNCTACRRYGVLWAYDHEGEGIHVAGPTKAYVRGDSMLGFHFCSECGCVAYWRSLEPNEEGRRRIAVNLRLAEPDLVAHVPIKHFDGLDTFDALPSDGKCVRDYWF